MIHKHGVSTLKNITFDTIKETRDGYIVRYYPDINNNFADLCICFVKEDINEAEIVKIMEEELACWIKKYPIPIMASAFDNSDQLIHIKDFNHSFLYGWIDHQTKELKSTWNSDDGKIIETIECKNGWDIVIKNISFRTSAQIKEQGNVWIKQRQKEVRTAKIFGIIWLGVIPLSWIAIKNFSYKWISIIATVYSVWKIIKNVKKICFAKIGEKETPEQEKKRKMEFYYYHCERNPLGFNKLRAENLKKESQEQIAKEYAELKATENSR